VPSSGVRIVLAGEDQAHRALMTHLADRVLLDEAAKRSADWINDESLQFFRSYSGRGDEDRPEHLRFYPLAQAKADAEDLPKHRTIGGRRIKLHGHIDGKPLRPEAGFWRRVLLLLAGDDPPPDLLIVAHDTDGDRARVKDLEQAVALTHPIPVIIAAPHQDAEAWFVAGFRPRSDAEHRRLSERRKELSFDPPEEPHRLTAHPNDARTDAKRVLRIFVFDEDASRAPTLEEMGDLCERTLDDLALLERRGEACGLAAFLAAVRSTLAPRVIDPARG
jgi:hypothetical protein